MIRWFLLVLFACLAGNLSAQMLTNIEGRVMSDEPFFNNEFIRYNKLAWMEGVYSEKRNNQPIKPRKEAVHYRFDATGNLRLISRIFNAGSRTADTVNLAFVYDASNQLIARKRSENGGTTTYAYRYDGAGRLIETEHFRSGENLYQSAEVSVPQGVRVNRETFAYQDFAGQQKCTVFNAQGKPYREEIRYTDTLGYLTGKSSRYLVTSGYQQAQYAYNDRGWLIREVSTGLQGDTTRREFTYDNLGNVLSEDVYRGSKHTEHAEFLYDEHTAILKAILRKDVPTGTIGIVQFTWGFAEE